MLIEGAIVTGLKTALLSKEIISIGGLCTTTGIGALIMKYTNKAEPTRTDLALRLCTYIIILSFLVGFSILSAIPTIQIIEEVFMLF